MLPQEVAVGPPDRDIGLDAAGRDREPAAHVFPGASVTGADLTAASSTNLNAVNLPLPSSRPMSTILSQAQTGGILAISTMWMPESDTGGPAADSRTSSFVRSNAAGGPNSPCSESGGPSASLANGGGGNYSHEPSIISVPSARPPPSPSPSSRGSRSGSFLKMDGLDLDTRSALTPGVTTNTIVTEQSSQWIPASPKSSELSHPQRARSLAPSVSSTDGGAWLRRDDSSVDQEIREAVEEALALPPSTPDWSSAAPSPVDEATGSALYQILHINLSSSLSLGGHLDEGSAASSPIVDDIPNLTHKAAEAEKQSDNTIGSPASESGAFTSANPVIGVESAAGELDSEITLPCLQLLQFFDPSDPTLPSIESQVNAMPVQKSGYLFRMNVPAGHRDAVLTEASGLGLTRSLSSMWKNRRTAAADSTRRKSANRVNNPTSDRPNISAEESALDTLLSRSQSQRTIQARHHDVEANASGDDGSDAPVSSQPTQEPSRSASSGWTLYYVEIRGRYMLFYSVPQAIPASSPGDASASSPGGISAYTGGAYTSSPTTLVSVTFEEPPPPPPPTSIVDSSGNTPTPPLQQVPSRGWRLGPRPLTPTRDPRVGDGRDRKSANSESSSGLNRIIESISYSTRNAAALAKRRMSIFTPALQAREPVVHHPKVTQRRSFEVGAGGLPSPSLIKNGPKTLSHYVDLRGASLEMAPSRNQSIFSATTHIMKLSLADDAILLDLFDELTWESHITANEMTVSSVGSVYGRPTPASKTVECGEWISAVNAANGSPPLIISSRDSSRGSIGSARRPTNLTAPKFPDIRKSQSANSASSAALEHAKRSESPVAMSAGQGLSSKPSISRFFSRQRKTSVESVVFDYRRESPVPPLPTPPHQPMTTSPFAVGEPSAPSSARPMDISQTTPSSGVSSGPSRNLSFKSRSRGVLSQKSRPPPAPAEVSNFTAGDQTDISTTAARSKSKEGRSTTLNGSTLVQPVASVTETHKSETSTAATAPTQSSHRDSATSSKVFNGLRSRNQRQTGSENASSQHTQEGVQQLQSPQQQHPPLAMSKTAHRKQVKPAVDTGRTVLAGRFPSSPLRESSSDGVVMNRSATVGSRKTGSFSPKQSRGQISRDHPTPLASGPSNSSSLNSQQHRQEEDGEEVPLLLRKCVELIEAIGLGTEGLYRIPGSAVAQEKLKRMLLSDPTRVHLLPPSSSSLVRDSPILPTKDRFNPASNMANAERASAKNKGTRTARAKSHGRAFDQEERYKKKDPIRREDYADLYDNDVHVVTGVVKSYLRSIEPLCTFEKYDTFMKAVAAPEWRQKMIAVQDAIHALPRSSFITLKFICDHLKRVSEREVENRMSVRNLSIVFAPNLLRPPQALDSVQKVLQDMPLQVSLVELCIEYADWIFGPVEYEEVTVSAAPEDSNTTAGSEPTPSDQERLRKVSIDSTAAPMESMADFSARFTLLDLRIVSPGGEESARSGLLQDGPRQRSVRTSWSDSSLTSVDRRRRDLRSDRRRAQVMSLTPDAGGGVASMLDDDDATSSPSSTSGRASASGSKILEKASLDLTQPNESDPWTVTDSRNAAPAAISTVPLSSILSSSPSSTSATLAFQVHSKPTEGTN